MLPRAIAVVRILIGATFLTLGILLLMDPAFLYGGLLLRLSEHGQPYSFYNRYVLDRYVEYRQELVAYALAGSEILLGVSFVTGALVSLASLGGALLVLNFGMATAAGKPLVMAMHILFALAFLSLGRYGAGLTWGVDGWLARRINEVLVLFPLRLSLPAYFTLDEPET